MNVTPAQLRVLRITKADGTLIIGGIDGRKVRKDVVLRLRDLGLLRWKAPSSLYEHSEWLLTEAGQDVLRRSSTRSDK